MSTSAKQPRMPYIEALRVLHELRREELVVTTMGAAREWPKLSQSPLDFHYVPSAMGHAPALALGFALAQPQREVIVLNGDGCTLMGLSSLVTIVASGAKNVTVVVMDNGIYEVTGGQTTAGGAIDVDFAGVARAAGFGNVHRFDNLATWRTTAAGILAQPGPRFMCLRVEPVGENFHLAPPEPISDGMRRVRATLASH